MKILRKTASVLKDNAGESMVEVIVAFTVLSIMLLVFAEGLQMATKTEVRADQTRDAADAAMSNVQSKIASDDYSGMSNAGTINVGSGEITAYSYTVDGHTYIVYKAG